MASVETPEKIIARKPKWFEEKFSTPRTSNDGPNAEAEAPDDSGSKPTTPLVKKRPAMSSLYEGSSPSPSQSPSQAREKSQSTHSAIPFAGSSERHRESSEHRESSTHCYSASAATYRRHDKLSASANALLELLLRHQRTPQLEYVEEDEVALRLALHNLRDQCVSANKRVLDKEMALALASPRPGATAPPFMTSGESVELHCALAVIFANSLCFEEQPERLSVPALTGLLQRFHTAEATGDVAQFQRVIFEVVNEILLYTPLDLEPHLNHAEPSIAGERDCAATPTPSKGRAVDGNISMTSCERPSANLRETELNFFSIRSDDDDAAAGSGGVTIKFGACAPWRTYFNIGYVNYLRQQGLISDEEADSAPHIVLPCDRWFSAATAYEQFVQLLVALFFSRGADLLNYTARVHKLVQFFELHTAWTASVETPARPMDVVGMDIVAEDGSCESVGEVAADGIENAEHEPEPEPEPEPEAESVEEAEPARELEAAPAEPQPEKEEEEEEEAEEQQKEEEEDQKEEEEEHDEMEEAEEAETEDEPEDKIELYKQQQKELQEKERTSVIYYFHSAENSPHRESRSPSHPQENEEEKAAQPADAEPETEEKKPFERRHKCYAAGEAPEHLEPKKRIVVEKITTKESEGEKKEQEEPGVEAVPIKRAERGGLQLPEGTVHKSRQ